MGHIYFTQNEAGKKAREEYRKKYEILLEQEYKRLRLDPEDPKYSSLPKEDIELLNEVIKRALEDELWGSKL